MDKIVIDLGGYPYVGDDYEWIMGRLSETLTALAETYNYPSLVISGCEVTIGGGNISWTKGLIYINSELCLVDAGTAAYPGNTDWTILETYDPLGTVVDEDLNTTNAYVYRRAVISGNGSGGVGDLYFQNVKYLKDINPDKFIAQTSLISAIGSGWSVSTADILVTRSGIGECMFDGQISISSFSNSTSAVAMNLPVDYRPADVYTVLCPAIVGSTRTAIHVEVSSTGTVKPLGITNGSSVLLIMDGLRYPYV